MLFILSLLIPQISNKHVINHGSLISFFRVLQKNSCEIHQDVRKYIDSSEMLMAFRKEIYREEMRQ